MAPRNKHDGDSRLDGLLRFCLENKLVVALIVLFCGRLGRHGRAVRLGPRRAAARSRSPVDAIPDIGENQQIVFTEWMGRSPQDVEDQITYPLTVSLLGIPGVKTVRSYSMFGFSMIYVIFEEDVDVRLVAHPGPREARTACPPGTLPEGVQPALGPDATALGQIFWYTLEGRDPDGQPGRRLGPGRAADHPGLVRALRPARAPRASARSPRSAASCRSTRSTWTPTPCGRTGVAWTRSSRPCGCRTSTWAPGTIELNRVEYLIRGLGFIKQRRGHREHRRQGQRERADLRQGRGHGRAGARPAAGRAGQGRRRGRRRRGGRPATATTRWQAIKNVKAKIAEIARRVSPSKKTLAPTASRAAQVTDRALLRPHGLIYETLGTLNDGACTRRSWSPSSSSSSWLMHLRSSAPDHRAVCRWPC